MRGELGGRAGFVDLMKSCKLSLGPRDQKRPLRPSLGCRYQIRLLRLKKQDM